MKKKELNCLVVAGLKSSLEPDGFKYNKSQDEFRLKINNFTFIVSYHCVDRNPEFIIEFFLQIRQEEVENIANRFSSSNPDSFKFSTTITVRLSYFTGKQMKFKVENENDIQNLFDIFFVPFYKSHIKSFIEKYSSNEEISKILNDSVTHDILGIPVNIHSFQRNIILLKLISSPDFENIVQHLREKIKNFPDIDKNMFEMTYNYLKSM